MKPELSIVIATHNRASILKKCLELLSLQEGPSFEVIVVDDGSTDNTKEVVSSFLPLKKISLVTNDVHYKASQDQESLKSIVSLLKTGKVEKTDSLKKQINSLIKIKSLKLALYRKPYKIRTKIFKYLKL